MPPKPSGLSLFDSPLERDGFELPVPRERDPLRDGKKRLQRVAELFEFASRPDLRLTGAASSDLLEIGEFDLERYRAALAQDEVERIRL
jgi:hypothetical protein